MLVGLIHAILSVSFLVAPVFIFGSSNYGAHAKSSRREDELWYVSRIIALVQLLQ